MEPWISDPCLNVCLVWGWGERGRSPQHAASVIRRAQRHVLIRRWEALITQTADTPTSAYEGLTTSSKERRLSHFLSGIYHIISTMNEEERDSDPPPGGACPASTPRGGSCVYSAAGARPYGA